MKKLFILFAACMMTASMIAQQPYGQTHHPQPQVVERHHHDDRRDDRHNHRHDHHPAPPMPCATPEQMQMVMQTLKAQSFDEKKLEIAQLCVTIGHFCTDDLALMAGEFAFDDNRLFFLQYAYPYCSDPERYPALQECFAFRSNYDKLMQSIYKK